MTRSNGHPRLLSGWRASGTFLLIVAAAFTIIAWSILFVAVFRLGGGWQSLGGDIVAYSGSCETSTRVNLGVHVLLNVFGSVILASSNFFMQILLAPTRPELDKAHERSQFAEIGVQSFRNLRIVPRTNVALWFVLGLTSVPLHLVLNSCVLESKASTDFTYVVAADGFVRGASYEWPGVAARLWLSFGDGGMKNTLTNIQSSLSTNSWERIRFEECWQRYNKTDTPLTDHRHVILVVSPRNQSESPGWTPRELRFNATDDGYGSVLDVESSLLFSVSISRTDTSINRLPPLDRDFERQYLRPDFKAGTLTTANSSKGTSSIRWPRYPINGSYVNHSIFRDPAQSFSVQHCLSESFTPVCKLIIEPKLLGVVCVICIIKCMLGTITVLKLRSRALLATPGDTIESYIQQPNASMRGKSSLNRHDFAASTRSGYGWHQDTPPKY